MEDEMCPPLPSSISPANSPGSESESENFSLHFASMYHSIFPPLLSLSSSSSSSSLPTSLSFTPSPSSSSADDHLLHHHRTAAAENPSTDDLLFQARIVLEHRELRQRHHLCLRRLREVTDDGDCLRRENAQLRLANSELVKVLSSKTGVDDLVAIPNSHLRSLIEGGQNRDEIGNYEIISPTSVIGKYNNQFDRRNYRRRISLPKSISVRSPAASTPLNIQTEEEANNNNNIQGMVKTEVCNKWAGDSGHCPYGKHCRFSHGIEELRPVMRHPRYKTQICRIILSGQNCPYAHRCHFRHSL